MRSTYRTIKLVLPTPLSPSSATLTTMFSPVAAVPAVAAAASPAPASPASPATPAAPSSANAVAPPRTEMAGGATTPASAAVLAAFDAFQPVSPAAALPAPPPALPPSLPRASITPLKQVAIAHPISTSGEFHWNLLIAATVLRLVVCCLEAGEMSCSSLFVCSGEGPSILQALPVLACHGAGGLDQHISCAMGRDETKPLWERVVL